MKNIICLFVVLWGYLMIACVDEDASTDVNVPSQIVLSDDTPVNAKVKEMYEKYGSYFIYKFDDLDLRYDWSTLITLPKYKYPKENCIIDVLDFLDTEVLGILPTELRKYISYNVYLTDSLWGSYNEWTGHLLKSKLILGRVGERFVDLDKKELRDAWLSLFVERMLDSWPEPTEFAQISNDGYNPSVTLPSGTVSKNAYLASSTDIVGKYAILKFGRKGKYNSSGTRLHVTTFAQDFGDYVAFIMFKSQEEKEAYYAKNENVKRKVDLVKEYLLTNFHVVLPEK